MCILRTNFAITVGSKDLQLTKKFELQQFKKLSLAVEPTTNEFNSPFFTGGGMDGGWEGERIRFLVLFFAMVVNASLEVFGVCLLGVPMQSLWLHFPVSCAYLGPWQTLK